MELAVTFYFMIAIGVFIQLFERGLKPTTSLIGAISWPLLLGVVIGDVTYTAFQGNLDRLASRKTNE